MAHPVIVFWSSPDQQAICLEQDSVGEGNLLINGFLVDPIERGDSSVRLKGIARQISITSSGDDFSGNDFTIAGTYRNSPFSETITGPTAGSTVYTTSYFSTVDVVFVNGALDGISVGTGIEGELDWILLDNFVPTFNVGLTVNVSGTITYTLEATNENPLFVNPPNGSIFQPTDDDWKNATTSQILEFTLPTRAIRLLVVNTEGDDGGLIFNVLQQGI